MGVSDQSTGPRRVTVVLAGGEADSQVLTMLGAVLAEVGAEVGAEVAGLFLEDVDLFRLAELPISREISRFTSQARPLRAAELRRQVRVQAARAERAVQIAAERAGLAWSFQTLRGRLGTALESAGEVEWVLVSAAQRLVGAAAEIRAVSRSTGRATGHRALPIVAVFDGSARATLALRTAMRVAESNRRRLEVLLPAVTDATLTVLRSDVREVAGEPTLRMTTIPDLESESIAKALRERPAGLLVLAPDAKHVAEPEIRRLLQRIGCPILLVR